MDQEMTTCVLTEIGEIRISASPDGVCRVHFPAGNDRPLRRSPMQRGGSRSGSTNSPLRTLVDRAAEEIQRYAAGELRRFTVPLDLHGTPFQREVWKALREIPYGETRTYGEIAARIGKPRAARAVGMACNRNPVGIIVPCHRVVGAGGDLTGYAGGIDLKAKLLNLERRFIGSNDEVGAGFSLRVDQKEILNGRLAQRGSGPA